jgi:hypothetical protein
MIFYAGQRTDIAFEENEIRPPPALQWGITPFGGGRGRLRYANFWTQFFQNNISLIKIVKNTWLFRK